MPTIRVELMEGRTPEQCLHDADLAGAAAPARRSARAARALRPPHTYTGI